MTSTVDTASLVEAATGDRDTGPEHEPIPLPSDPRLMLQAIELLLVAIAVMYVARTIVLPIVLAVMLKLLLQPAMRGLERFHVPRALAAIALLGGLFALVVGIGAGVTAPAQSWISKLPEGLPRLQERLSFLSQPLGAVQRFLVDADNFYTHAITAAPATVAPAPAPSPANGLAQTLFSGTASFASGFITTFVLLFFLLVSGDTFLRRLVEILPRFRDKKQAVLISQQIESDIAAYLFTVTVMNVVVGVATTLLVWALGLDNPPLWGVLAFMLNYVPLLGPVVFLCVMLVVGLLTMDTLWRALLPAAGFLCIHAAEGQFVTPTLLARRFTLNPVVVMVSLMFWYWMWGVPGAILAVPMLALVKIVCDGVRPWAAIGHLIGG